MREVGGMARPGRPDARTPFFISYAHTGAESDERANLFYHRLCGHIQTLVDVPVGTALGFFDQDGISPAVLWDKELAEALGTCQVMVALLNPPYLNRVWCAKEWHAFTLRKSEPLPGATGSPNLGPILPVRWAPIPASVKIPREVGKPQFFTPTNTSKQPGLVKSYEEDGVYHLLEDDDNAARTIVWQLAKRIQDIYYSHRLLPRVFKQGDLRNVFESGDP
jgi:TIR domain